MAVNPQLYEELAKALAQPSRAFRAAKEGLGIPKAGIEGYMHGAESAEKLNEMKFNNQTLAEALGGNVPDSVSEYRDLKVRQFKPTAELLTGVSAYEKAEKSNEKKDPGSLDAYLTREVVAGRMKPEEAYSMKNKGLLLRAGYEEGEGGGLTPVPGGKPARDIAEENAKKEVRAREEKEKANTVISAIDSTLPKLGILTSGFIGSKTKDIGGTPAANVDAALNTIRSNVGFDALQKMRESSPTHGALGQISDRENTLLQSVRGSLEQKQSSDQLADTLTKLRKHFVNVRLINESQTGDPEADDAIAQVISSGISEQEKRARIKGIRSKAGR